MIELTKNKYQEILPFIKQVDFNHMFAKSVLDDAIDGNVYVDSRENPSSFYILHSYGMALLFGNEKNPEFNSWLRYYLLNVGKKRSQVEWLQVFPDAWSDKLSELLGENLLRKKETQEIIDESAANKIVENTRVNFKFSYNAYRLFKENIMLKNYNIVRTNKELFSKMDGAVVPKAFWKSAEQFEQSGVGFSLIVDEKLVSTAYSAFIHDNQLELGIETVPGFKGKGFAAICCAVLIDYCIANDFEPVWSCKLENVGSFKLAQKMGFEPVSYRPYYMVKI
jgi:hypothetical protein